MSIMEEIQNAIFQAKREGYVPSRILLNKSAHTDLLKSTFDSSLRPWVYERVFNLVFLMDGVQEERVKIEHLDFTYIRDILYQIATSSSHIALWGELAQCASDSDLQKLEDLLS